MRRKLTWGLIVAALLAAVAGPAFAYVSLSASTGTATTAGLLGAPGSLHTQRLANGDIRLTWTKPSGVDPTSYRIQRSVFGSGTWSTRGLTVDCVTPPPGQCTTDDPANQYTGYEYRIMSASGANWLSDPSAPRAAVTLTSASGTLGPADTTLNSVAVLPGSPVRLVAVGDGGRILGCTFSCTGGAAVWVPIDNPATHDLNRVSVEATTGQVWVVGDAGTLLTCTASCAQPGSTWTTVPAGTGADLQGVFASGTYAAVVGASGTFRISTDTGAHWTAGTLASPPGGTLSAVAGRNPKNVVVVGTGASYGCALGNAVIGVCGDATHSLGSTTPVGSPDLHDAAALTSGSSTYATVGSAGAVYAGTSSTGWTAQTLTTGADYLGVAVISSSSGMAVGSGGKVSACTGSCASSATAWAAPATAGTVTATLRGVTGRGSNFWAVGGDSGPVILLYNGASWVTQSAPTTLPSPSVLDTRDGVYVSLGTYPESATLPTDCRAPSLTATVTVLSGHGSDAVRARVGLTFPGGPTAPHAQVLTSLDGHTWLPPRPLDPGAPVSSATLTGGTGALILDDSATQTVHLCIEAASDAGAMRVDMVRLDLDQ